jgi:hypothetical protein
MKMNGRERLLLAGGGVLLLVIAALVGGLVYGAHRAALVTLRWWAVGATLALPLAGGVGFLLGQTEARGHVAGLKQGIEAVQVSTQRTVDAAGRVADVRVRATQRLKQKPQPAIQQVFLPGLTSGGMGGGPGVIVPLQQDGGDVEL